MVHSCITQDASVDGTPTRKFRKHMQDHGSTIEDMQKWDGFAAAPIQDANR